MASEYEERARRRKAANITSHLRGKGVTSQQIQSMSSAERESHVAAAGERNASEATWNAVLSSVQFLERNPGPEDPFEGLS